jgi:hypothetical protein
MRGGLIRIVIGLGLVGVSAFTLVRKFSAVTYVATTSNAGSPDPAVTAFHDRFGASLQAKLAATVEVPAFVYAGETRTVTAKLEDFHLGDELENHFLLDFYEAPEFTLAIPGVELKPKEWLALTPGGRTPAVWSVRGISPGSFAITMTARLEPRNWSDRIAELRKDPSRQKGVAMLEALPTPSWALELGRMGEQKMMLVKERSWADYLDTGARIAVGLLGSVLTLQAIAGFFGKEHARQGSDPEIVAGQ